MSDEMPPNYFAGHRRRSPSEEEAGEAKAEAIERVQAISARFVLSPGSDVTEGAMRISLPREQPRLDDNYASDGTYIPLGGGLRGWFQNSGVPKSEARNHYRFHEAVDGQAFERTILNRVESFNRRAVVRMKVDLWATYRRGDSEVSQVAYCVDLSVAGARLRTREPLTIGERLQVSLFRQRDGVGKEEPVVAVAAEVTNMRLARSHAGSSRYYAGIAFAEPSIDAKETLARLAAEGTPLRPD